MLKIKRFEVNLFGENTFVVWDEKTREAIVVDPGMSDAEERQEVDDYISENGLRLKAIVLTHMHIDHILGVEHLREKYGVPVYANEGDLPLGQAAVSQAQMFHLPYSVKPVGIDVSIGDGDTVTIGDETLQVRQVPGHSPGGIILYSPTGKIALTGDSIFERSVGRTDLPGADHQTLINAIHSEIMSLPEDTLLLPGHGPKTTVGAEAHFNPFL